MPGRECRAGFYTHALTGQATNPCAHTEGIAMQTATLLKVNITSSSDMPRFALSAIFEILLGMVHGTPVGLCQRCHPQSRADARPSGGRVAQRLAIAGDRHYRINRIPVGRNMRRRSPSRFHRGVAVDTCLLSDDSPSCLRHDALAASLHVPALERVHHAHWRPRLISIWNYFICVSSVPHARGRLLHAAELSAPLSVRAILA